MTETISKPTNLQQDFLEHVQDLENIRGVLKKDILRQLENRGNTNSSFSNLVNSVESVLPKEYFQNFITIGGTFVRIEKSDEIIFPKTSYCELHSVCPEAVNVEGKIVNAKSLLGFLASKINIGESVFVDFGFPTNPVINSFGLADGLVLKNSKGNFVRKSHDLQNIQGIQIADYVSNIVKAKCSSTNDVIFGLLPDYDIHVISGTGVNIGYRIGNQLINLEGGLSESEFLFKIPSLADGRKNVQAFTAGGPDRILSPADYWGIGGVYNCLSENLKVENAKEVFVNANQSDKLARAVLIYARFLINLMLESVIEHSKIANPKINYTGSVLNPLLMSNFIL
jgi:hypothetical protein